LVCRELARWSKITTPLCRALASCVVSTQIADRFSKELMFFFFGIRMFFIGNFFIGIRLGYGVLGLGLTLCRL
jgi:hypothetical protein